MRTTGNPALVLIAHGTRDPAGPREMAHLVEQLRQRLAAPVAAAWLEDFAEPDPVTAAGHVVAGGATALVTLPFLLLGAGHAKTDVPEHVRQIRQRFTHLTVLHGRVLGLHHRLLELASDQVRASSDDSAHEALVVTGAGSSDPDANGDLAKAGRLLAEQTGHRWVEIAYAGVTWPRADDMFAKLHRAGANRIIRFSWSLLAGVLERRIAGWAADATSRYGIEIRDAGRFGPEPAVADAVVERYHEALAGDARMNCDLCAYRVPLAGLEGRVGAPSAGGLGSAVDPAAPR